MDRLRRKRLFDKVCIYLSSKKRFLSITVVTKVYTKTLILLDFLRNLYIDDICDNNLYVVAVIALALVHTRERHQERDTAFK